MYSIRAFLHIRQDHYLFNFLHFVVACVMSIPGISQYLQKYMNKILGPILIIVGMLLLELIQFNISGSIAGEKMQKRAEKAGIWGAGLLGRGFSLSFCLVSAARGIILNFSHSFSFPSMNRGQKAITNYLLLLRNDIFLFKTKVGKYNTQHA